MRRGGGEGLRVEDQVPPARDVPALAARASDPLALFALALNRPADVETPDRLGVCRHGEAHLGEGDAKFGDPAVGRRARDDLPYRVVVAVLARVVEPTHVALNPGRIGFEDVRRLMIVAGIEADTDLIRGREVVATAESGDDAFGRAVETPDRHVDVARVECDLGDRALAQRRHVLGLPLHEVADGAG
ncbi:MAG TPA: hypothetical protein DCP38_12795 [Acidobacteria bacterium]|nr:hypothetical protein [Acidobacteriota bacterium]